MSVRVVTVLLVLLKKFKEIYLGLKGLKRSLWVWCIGINKVSRKEINRKEEKREGEIPVNDIQMWS